MNELEQEYPKIQKVIQEPEPEPETETESNSDSETKQYDIYNSRNQHKKWGVKSWFDNLWN